MKLTPYLFLLFALLSISCEDDDGGVEAIPIRDRAEEALVAQLEIEEFLQTHFYNYEAFESPSSDFDFNIVIDTIAGDNQDKIPLIDQVDFKTVIDRVDEDVTYKFYYLKVIQGVGDSPEFPDLAIVSYEGRFLNRDLFDASTIPVRFDLTSVVNGFQDALVEFNGAGNIIKNPDGTVSFEDFGVGAVFIPSGLGYFENPPSNTGIGLYDQLFFTFNLFEAEQGDQDVDGILSIHEDLNNDGIEENDDTDEDGVANFRDNDDDQDGTLTIDEIKDEDGNVITDPALYPDSDGDGTPDYLDSDS